MVWNNLGNLLMQVDRLAEARAACREAVRLDPSNAIHHYTLGMALRTAGDLPAALKEYRTAIQINPEFARAHYHEGRVLYLQRQFRAATEAYRRSLKIEEDADVYFSLGAAHYEVPDIAGAIDAYQKAIRLNPKLATAHMNLGAIYFRQLKHADAIACARKAVEADPNMAVAYAMLGDALQRTGDISGARTAFSQAAQLDKRWMPNSPTCRQANSFYHREINP